MSVVFENSREQVMIDICKMRPGKDRYDADAYIQSIPFELKSTWTQYFCTARDFGLSHLKKYKRAHWLFGVFEPNTTQLSCMYYATPEQMRPWLNHVEHNIRPLLLLAKYTTAAITPSVVYKIFGKKNTYTEAELRAYLVPRQTVITATTYSLPETILILRECVKQKLQRGATINNPHIPLSYLRNMEKLTTNYANTLRKVI